MQIRSREFKTRATEKLGSATLFKALSNLRSRLVVGRANCIQELDNFEDIREAAKRVRDDALEHLDFLLEEFERNATANGAKVHWAEDSLEMNQLVLDIARKANVRKVIKSKSMLGEESGLNHFLEQGGIEVRETDLGEYIIQESGDVPSHIIGPAIHRTKEEVADLFHEKHQRPRKTDITEMTWEAREILRPHFLTADMGISGANFLVAETGTSMIVTNEGNGRMTTTLPRVHVAIAGIEKVLPTLEDVSFILRLLTRSATGQSISNYLTFTTGPKRPGRHRRAGRVSHHHRRLGPYQSTGLRAARSATLHPLWGLHEPLSGVPEHRRTPLWMGLPGPDRLGAHSRVRGARERTGLAQCRYAVQSVWRGLPREDSVA